MFGIPKNGWVDFNCENFHGHASYIQDVPLDVLEGIYDFLQRGSTSIFFDEEGSFFSIVITPYDVYVISEKDKAELINTNYQIEEFVCETVEHIKSHKKEWLDFMTDEDKSTLESKMDDLIVKIENDEYYKRLYHLNSYVKEEQEENL